MEIRKHFFMTFSALFFLGLILGKPESAFTPVDIEYKECKFVRKSLACDLENKVARDAPSISYQYE
jgi:hypothetical protein